MRSLVICAALMGCGVTAVSAQEAIRWHHDLDKARQAAAQSNRLVLIHFVGRNCAPCERIETNVFSQPSFIKGLESEYVPVKINGTDLPITARQFNIESFPTDVVMTPAGQIVAKTSCPQDSTVYLAQVLEIADNHRKLVAYTTRTNGGATAANQQAVSPFTGRPPAVVGNVQIGETPVGNARPQQPIQQPVAQQPQLPSQQQPQVAYQPNGATTVAGQAMGYQPGVGQGGYAQPNGAQPNVAYQPAGNPNVAAVGAAAPPAAQPAAPPMTGYRPPSGRYQEPQNVAAAQAAKAVLGLDGQCPVSLHEFNGRKLVPGDARFGAMHRGRLYLFATAAHQQKFFSEPDRYSPMLAGYDPVRWAETGQLVPGKLQNGVFLQDRVYLFADEASLAKFEKDSSRFIAPIEQAMRMTGRGTIQR